MDVKEIAFVCYAVDDLEKGREFYEKVLNLKPVSVWVNEGKGMIEYEFGPYTLAIGCGAPQFVSGKAGATAALEVGDFAKAVASLKEAAVKFLMEPQDTSVCMMALIEDPFGNQIMIHQRKAK